MTNFKGTKGKWDWCYDKYDDCYQVAAGKIVAMTFYDSDEDKANAVLISKAPEMLDEIQESLIDIQILRDQIAKESEINHRFEGMAGIMDNWINRKKQLIKEATEL